MQTNLSIIKSTVPFVFSNLCNFVTPRQACPSDAFVPTTSLWQNATSNQRVEGTMKLRFLQVLVATVFLFSFTAPQTVWAQSAPTFEQVMDQAQEAREQGDLRRAADLVQQAYNMRPIPELMNNLGKVYEELGDLNKAYQCYELVVNNPKASAKLRKIDRKRMKAIKKRLASGQGASAPSQSGWAGSYQDADGMVVEFSGSGNRYIGRMSMQGESASIQGNVRGNTMNGTVDMMGESMPFKATLKGNQIVMDADGMVTTLNRVGAGGPAPVAPSAPSAEPMDDDDDIADWGIDPNTGEPLNQGMNPQGQGTNPGINGNGTNAAPQGMGSPVNTSARATRGGKINLKHAGFSFQRPKNWKHQKSDEKVIFGHMTIPGMVIVSRHEGTSLADLQAEAANGLKIDDNTTFQLRGQLRPFGENGYAAEFVGMVPGKGQGIAYTIGLLSPHGGGALVMFLGLESDLTAPMKNIVHGIAKSFRFAKQVAYPEDQTWKRKLVGYKLTYMNTTSSSGYDGSYSGGSSKEVIRLCNPGQFGYYSNSSYTVNAGEGVGSNTGSGSTAYGRNRGGGGGTWTVRKIDGQVKLVLKFENGTVNQYTISQDGSKTFLNGTRYFRTRCD
jgi:hypothetical protein